MRKQLIPPTSETVRAHDEGWLDLEPVATVEVTSEDRRGSIDDYGHREETLNMTHIWRMNS